ncbi:hypothetical protein IMZ11_38635 [Microtetraspora sp. AC03309]|uniref:hypothetical protein n=1 Tax=Microtetraspora sp. AC03309 TaxID=2779376 RepID=UPI001E5A3067|nr:hypothetical protein [Microtetraspora sp. AC03309]MCC5581536.1 hypothetical protein [Microtetraspora sp. AC03309]
MVGVSLAVMGNDLHVTVLSSAGKVAQAVCTVNPTPGTGSNPAWPGNCVHDGVGFVDLSPPNNLVSRQSRPQARQATPAIAPYEEGTEPRILAIAHLLNRC